MRSQATRLSLIISQRARVQLARGLWLAAGLVIAGAALLFTVYLSSFGDSTRAASDLADLRTHAQRVALAADLAAGGADMAALEDAILAAEQQTRELPEYLRRVLGDDEADRLMGHLEAAWTETAEAARTYVANGGDLTTVVAAADETGVAVGDLLAVLAARSESRTAQFNAALRGGVTFLVLGGALFASAILRQRRRAREIDALTGVLARDRFRDQLEVELLNRRSNGSLAIAVVDIDRFRRINQTLGAEQGDRVLRDVARRIQDAIPRDGCVGRRGGDEFLVLLPGKDGMTARAVVQDILSALDQPLVYQTGELRAGASIGLAVAPRDGTESKSLLRAADAALDNAKSDGGSTYRFAAGSVTSSVSDDPLALEAELRQALENDEFELHYQPQVDVSSGEIVGAEALLRWRSDARGLVPPDQFIPLLEESRLVVPVGAWAIRTAAIQAKEWLDLCGRGFRISVNVSARQLFQSDLVSTVRDAIAESGLPPTSLELEVTETVAIQHPDEAVRVLEAISALGVRSALDDFGTGYSWLSHLKLLPRMSLKIDRSFVAGITKNAEDHAIVAGLVTVAHTLQRTVIAEGVERAAELAMLEEMHCDIAQGFYFSRPLPAEEFATLLLQEHPWLPVAAA